MTTGENAPGEKTPGEKTERRAGMRPDLVFTVVLLVVFAAALVLARQWGFRASFVPTLVCAVGLALSLGHLALVLLGRTPRSRPADEPDAADPDLEDHDPARVFAAAAPARWRACLLWVAGFFAAVYVAGLVVAGVVFTLAYLRRGVGASWWFSAGYAAALGLVLWLVFGQVLAIRLPEGMFG